MPDLDEIVEETGDQGEPSMAYRYLKVKIDDLQIPKWWFSKRVKGINISHLGKRKIIFKMPFWGDMLVPWRVMCRDCAI